ncbi:MAG TPA: hypothetical protein VFK88_05625 [Gallionella sp.]|nr:hypothetical protein [Gallionella sp.]
MRVHQQGIGLVATDITQLREQFLDPVGAAISRAPFFQPAPELGCQHRIMQQCLAAPPQRITPGGDLPNLGVGNFSELPEFFLFNRSGYSLESYGSRDNNQDGEHDIPQQWKRG